MLKKPKNPKEAKATKKKQRNKIAKKATKPKKQNILKYENFQKY